MNVPFVLTRSFVAAAALCLVAAPSIAQDLRVTSNGGPAVSASSDPPVLDGAPFAQGFNDATLPVTWPTTNLSTESATGDSWRTVTAITLEGVPVVTPHEGAGFASVGFSATGADIGTISAWLFSPVVTQIRNGDRFSFFTTTVPGSAYPDRLQVRLNTANTGTMAGATPTDVGDYTNLLLDINPSYNIGGYPETWTQFTATVNGLAVPADGRVALRYFVESGGFLGDNSNIIGVDSFVYAPIPEPATWALALFGMAGLVGWRRLRLDR